MSRRLARRHDGPDKTCAERQPCANRQENERAAANTKRQQDDASTKTYGIYREEREFERREIFSPVGVLLFSRAHSQSVVSAIRLT